MPMLDSARDRPFDLRDCIRDWFDRGDEKVKERTINVKYFIRLFAFFFVLLPILFLSSLLFVPWLIIEWAYDDEKKSLASYLHEYWFEMWIDIFP